VLMTSLGSIIIERSLCKRRLIRRPRHESLHGEADEFGMRGGVGGRREIQ